MNRIIIYILATSFSFAVIPLYPQGNNRQQTTTNNVQSDNIFYHTVERGQTVYSIATMYGLKEDDLFRLNPGSREIIKAGEKLKIPQKTATPAATQEDGNYLFHTIQPKETLYSLSVKYAVPAADIVDANPGLSVATFIIGKNIRIPLSAKPDDLPQKQQTAVLEIEYKVEKRETLYRISRKFNVSPDELLARNPKLKDGVKADMVLIIPLKENAPAVQQTVAANEEQDANALLAVSATINKPDTIRIVLLLPFMIEEVIPTTYTARFIEYYEGMLLAIDSLRNKGVAIKLTVRDCGSGTKKIDVILKENALREAHLIIGAVENDQIAPVAAFAKKNSIKYVIPFTSRNDDVLANAYVFQVNTPHSYLYAKATQAAYDLFYDYNIVFVETNNQDEKIEFIRVFKQELSQHNVPYRDLFYTEASFHTDLELILRKDKRNVIIPTSGTLEALNKIRTPLRAFVEANPHCYVNLFGYPEWQTYARECMEDFFVLNTYIYTNFYADNLSPDITRFYSKYKIWYSKNLANTFPKYGILGFDTGMFFLDAMYRYGVDFEPYLGVINYKSLQTGFKFYRVNNWGGFINMNLFIVHYNKGNYKTIRYEIK